MKKLINKAKEYRRFLTTVKLLKSLANQMTVALPCVNLCVSRGFKRQVKIYNNDDLIALLDADDLTCLRSCGMHFCASFIYCLCVKYSIDKLC